MVTYDIFIRLFAAEIKLAADKNKNVQNGYLGGGG
jgi:hypothetical protein